MKDSQENGNPQNDVSLDVDLYEWREETEADNDFDDPSDLDESEANQDDWRWEAFIADDDERDPLPDVGDFWFEDD